MRYAQGLYDRLMHSLALYCQTTFFFYIWTEKWSGKRPIQVVYQRQTN